MAHLTSAQRTPVSRVDVRPAITVDLRLLGLEFPVHSPALRAYELMKNKVAFTDQSTLAVSFFVPNSNQGLSVRGRILGSPYLFQTVFLDARTGKALRTQTWSNSGIGCDLFPAPDGGFIISHDLDLSLHAPDGTVRTTLALNAKDFPRTPSVVQSPSGNTLFATRYDRQGSHVLRIRANDLHELGWSNIPGYFHGSGSDSHFAYTRYRNPPYAGSMDLFLLDLNGHDSESPEPKRIYATSNPGCDLVSFLDESTMAVSGSCPELIILSMSGDVLYEHRLEKELTGAVISCRDCNVLMTRTYVLHGGNAWLDTFPKAKAKSILILNRKTGNLVELPQSESGKNASSSALSPDGCFLATQTDARLDVYNLCAGEIGAKLHLQ
jgi:hypothetical protein